MVEVRASQYTRVVILQPVTISDCLSAAPLECFCFSSDSIYGRSQGLLALCLLALVAFSLSSQDLSTSPVS